MKKLIAFFSLFSVIAVGCQAKENALIPGGIQTEIPLACEGQSKAVIIIPCQASEQESQAAVYLKTYLERITSAKFPLRKDTDTNAGAFISVGPTVQLRQAGFEPIAAQLGHEGIAIKVADGNLFLIGGVNGIVNAVMAFLEEDLGCRWYSDKWEHIPRDKNLVARVTDRVSLPDFALRFVFSAHAMTHSPEWTLRNRVMKWNLFNHINDWFCHTYAQICPMSDFADHPDYFAKLPNGQPFNTQLCPTHPEIIKRAKERALAALRANTRKDVSLISISEYDGSTGYCHCSRCQEIIDEHHAPIAPHLTLVNEVARAIKDEFPTIKVDFLSYSRDFRTPPVAMEMESNVALWFCTSNSNRVESYRNNKDVEEFYKWRKLVDTVNVWEYGCDYSNYFRVMPSLPALIDNIKFWKANAIEGIMFLEVFGVRGGDQQALRAWILSKLLWNSQLDPDHLAMDFCQGVFSHAAPEMFEYYRLVSQAGAAAKTIEEFYGLSDFISQANAIFDRAFAKASAANDTELIHRIEVHYVPVAFMEIESIFGPYPSNRDTFPTQRYGMLLDRIKQITAREDMDKYSEIRSMSGRLAELELLINATSNGILGIDAIDATLYEYPVRQDALAKHGQAPRLPCDDNWLVQWHFPINLCVPGQAYQIRALLRSENDSAEPDVATGGMHAAEAPEKSFTYRLQGSQLSSKEYRWIEIGEPFVPQDKEYLWFSARAGSDIGGLFVDRIELVPAEN